MSNVQTYIMVEGELMNASLQPSQSNLQGAFRKGTNGTIRINMPAAKLIAKDMIRQARVAKFAEVDARRGLAFDTDNATEKTAVRAAAQKLRDAPADPRIDAATTPDALLSAVDTIISEF